MIDALFLRNEEIEEKIFSFCNDNPRYIAVKQQFLKESERIQEFIGYERYDQFESCFWNYLNCTADLYYLFGLGLRQELIREML